MNNRPLKFRVWDDIDKKWVKDFCVITDCGSVQIYNSYGIPTPPRKRVSEGEEYIIQQFTGLSDKNGKEIYEGDIVKETVEKGPNLPERYKDFILKDSVEQITWDYYTDGEYVEKIECFMFGDRNSLSELIHRTTGNYHEWLYTYEIIGNIFETPELLKN